MSARGRTRDADRLRLRARTWGSDGGLHDCSAAEIAWIALVPCALVLLLLIVVLGPPLGRAAFAPSGMAFWPEWRSAVKPEPTEHARYVLSLLGPLLLSGVVVLGARRRIPSRPRTLAVLVPLAQGLFVAFLLLALWVQRTTVFASVFQHEPPHHSYFSAPTLVAAALVALLLAFALRRPSALRRAATLVRDTPARRAVAIVAALALTALWLLTAFNTDGTVGRANQVAAINVGNWIDEAVAVLDHQAPLVHLRAQYGQLWPYLSAGVMAVFGTSLSVFAGTMLAGTAAAMLAVFALLRRLASSWLAALALFVPFVATSFFMEQGPLDNRYGPANLFSIFPMRYGGPYLLAWLTVRHLDGVRPRQRVLLFVVAGVVAVNNVEFGLPALGATLAAVVWTSAPFTVRSVALIARDVALGLLGGIAGVALLTLVVAGSLPHFGLALTFSRIFGIEGFGMLPMHAVGTQLVLYATFAAAIVVATLRALRDQADAPMTGMLAWIGVFGLGAGSYFVGRSHPEVLIDLFSPWALALMLLLVVVVRSAARQERWRPAVAELALLAGVGLTICSLAQMPAPWSQVDRLSRTTREPVFHPVAEERAIAAQTHSGESIAIVAPVGHRIAYDIGVVDVRPYSDPTMPAVRQLDDTVAALRAAGGNRLFLALWLPHEAEVAALQAAGFRLAGVLNEVELAVLVDTRSRAG